MEVAMRLYRYPDLVAMKIVTNRVTLARWQRCNGFPESIRLGPNSIAFDADAVDRFVATRAAQSFGKPAAQAA
jgi:predicted DNA-binding transcriptional regulator AlpA